MRDLVAFLWHHVGVDEDAATQNRFMNATDLPPRPAIQLGVRENLPQFALLVLVNAFVGATVGIERSILPSLAEATFEMAASSAILSFILVFGLTKACTNYFAGRFTDRFGRKPVLVAGWFVAIPVPFMLIGADSWSGILIANAFLGVSQGLTWSATVIMKIDLAGPRNRGTAMGLNEFSGYAALAISALATGLIAAEMGLRPYPFYLGFGYVGLGLTLSLLFVHETRDHAIHEHSARASNSPSSLQNTAPPSPAEIFRLGTWKDRNLASISQAGLVNNLNDGLAWGLFPLLFATVGLSLQQIAWLAAIYPALWGCSQLLIGPLSDRIGRKPLIQSGMWVQGVGLVTIAFGETFFTFAIAASLLGIGTGMVYPTLLAAIGDTTPPIWRASAVGIYRLWRDLGYAIGAVLAGFLADLFGIRASVGAIAVLTALSGLIVALRMREPTRL